VWRRRAEKHWLKAHEALLQARAHGQLVIVRRPGRKHLGLEIVCGSRSDSSALLNEFGGRIEALPRNWLERFAHGDSNPIKIGRRLMIVRPDALRTAHSTGHTIKPALLVIPASAAFGTGEHVTTAMSLRFVEQLTRSWNPGWSLADLGTGTGILALAGKRFGAGRVIGIDNDPTAISMAKSNARLNKIRGVSFELGDVHRWNSARETDVITANLYSDLLIEILPKISGGSWLILSGTLRSQQGELFRALRWNHLDIISMRRRGKWMAFLARNRRL
jgi:ribosomal protein L11 methyltransferase